MVAEHLAQSLEADVLALQEQTNREGILGFVKGGFDAIRHAPTLLTPCNKNLSDYDLVVIGSPVWAGTLSPAVRTFLRKAAPTIQRAAFFCTHGGGGASKSYADAESLLGKPLAATAALRDKAVKRGTVAPTIDTFVNQITK